MTATFIGIALIAVPLLAIGVGIVRTIGWDGFGLIVAAMFAAGALSGLMTFGIYLIAEGWPS